MDVISKNISPGNSTALNAEVGSHSLHLYMMRWAEEGKIDETISVHLSLKEVEDLIIELKHKLIKCYEARVEAI